MQKGKMVVSSGLTNGSLGKAEKIKEGKREGHKETYIHLNTEFQRTARRDKKAFLHDQCKEIEENNRMGKTRDLFKKIRDTKGTFHAKIGIPDHTYLPPEKHVCRSRATVRTGHGTMDWLQIGKGVCQGCILFLCLFNLYAEYIR